MCLMDGGVTTTVSMSYLKAMLLRMPIGCVAVFLG